MSFSLEASILKYFGNLKEPRIERNGEHSALHLVSAWASQHRLVLGQVKVEENSNEITPIPTLLNLLEIAGYIITIDAIGCQQSIERALASLVPVLNQESASPAHRAVLLEFLCGQKV
jgi:hypothetical protein